MERTVGRTVELRKTVCHQNETDLGKIGYEPVRNSTGDIYAYREPFSFDSEYADNPYYKNGKNTITTVNMV